LNEKLEVVKDGLGKITTVKKDTVQVLGKFGGVLL
jgi:hypothetical protein